MTPDTRERLITASVWIVRIALGATFIASGLAKTIDLWGTVYKMEEYLRLWDMAQPRSIVFMGALLLSGGELTLGAMMLLGCYRRAVVWLMLAMMAGMLPLTLYIYIANPVSDCGCFGDLFHLSNAATFWKNVLITAALVFLLFFNRRVRPLFTRWVQWIAASFVVAYALVIGLYGYNVQPLADFRSFPPGSSLLPDGDTATGSATFIYEKDGERQEFDMNSLPDSTWTYVDRVEPATQRLATEMALFDDDAAEVTEDVVPMEGKAMILTVAEPGRADISYTYFLNELNERITADGGSMIAIVAGAKPAIDAWRDLAMASYPVYSAEATLLKELARGPMALTSITDGHVDWKVNLSSVDPDSFMADFSDGNADALAPAGTGALRYLSLLLLVALAVLYILDSTGRLLQWRIRHRRKSVTKEPAPKESASKESASKDKE